MKPVHIYLDTSVYGGVFDEEFAVATSAFLKHVISPEFVLFTSDVITAELEQAPPRVKEFADIILRLTQYIPATPEIKELADGYLESKVLGPSHRRDALHAAYAVCARCDWLVSWNFGHLLDPVKVAKFNAVNTRFGYNPLVFISPREATI